MVKRGNVSRHVLPVVLAALSAAIVAWTVPARAEQIAQAADVPSAALGAVIDAAKKEGGTLDIMNASLADPAFIEAVSSGMSKRFGFPIHINVVPGPTPSALAPQLVDEFKAGHQASSDVFAGDDVNSMVLLKSDAAVKVDWKALSSSIPEEAVGPEGSFVRFASRIIGVVWYNTDLVKGEDVPHTLKDVLKPKWKGRLASTSFLAGFREAAGLFGHEQEMVDFLKGFHDSGNLGGFIRGGASERIISGEFAMFVVATGEYPVLKPRDDGAPIDFAIVRELPYVSFWTMSVPKNSAHPNLAQLFSVYMMSREGQDIHYKTQTFDLHYLPGSKTAAEFQKVFNGQPLQIVTNDVLTTKWSDYERVMPILDQAMRGSR